MSAARAAECRAILGGERDKFRIVWDEQATQKDRVLLLAMAGEPREMSARLARRAWGDLSPELRYEIKRGLKRWAEWADKLQ